MKINYGRTTIAALTLSAAGLVGLALNEGFRGEAYVPTKGDVPTIGFGTTKGVRLGDRIDPVTALQRKQAELSAEYEAAVKTCVHVPMYQHEFDAMVDTTYNIGAKAFCKSSMVARLNAGDYQGACDALLKWRMYKGKDCSLDANKRLCGGLWTRRQAAHKLCIEGR